MKKIAVLLLALATPVLAQEKPFMSYIITMDNCIYASITSTGEVEVNYKCAEEYAKRWKNNEPNETWVGIAVIMNAIHNGTAKVKELK